MSQNSTQAVYRLNAPQFHMLHDAIQFAHADGHAKHEDFNCEPLTALADTLNEQLRAAMERSPGLKGTDTIAFRLAPAQAALAAESVAAFRGDFEGKKELSSALPLPAKMTAAIAKVSEALTGLQAVLQGGGLLN